MPAISVIMPVYNSEKYLPMAIECILNQTFTDFEFICIDDGSTDKSGIICDEYASKDSRMIVIHQANGGICAARNRGLAKAKGDYIAFMDNDDECEDNLLEANYKVAIQYNADMVKFGRSTITVNGEKAGPSVKQNLEFRFYNREEIINNYFNLRLQCVFSPIWNGLYRNEVVKKNNIKFHEQLRFGEEDTVFCFDFIAVMSSLVLNSGHYFTHYIRHGHSASSKFHMEALEKHVYSAEAEYNLWNKLKLLDKHKEKQILCAISMHIIPVLHLFEHQNCDLTVLEKIRFMRKLALRPFFQYTLDHASIKFLLGVSKKYGIISILFQMRQYCLCIFLSKLQSFLG